MLLDWCFSSGYEWLHRRCLHATEPSEDIADSWLSRNWWRVEEIRVWVLEGTEWLRTSASGDPAMCCANHNIILNTLKIILISQVTHSRTNHVFMKIRVTKSSPFLNHPLFYHIIRKKERLFFLCTEKRKSKTRFLCFKKPANFVVWNISTIISIMLNQVAIMQARLGFRFHYYLNRLFNLCQKKFKVYTYILYLESVL